MSGGRLVVIHLRQFRTSLGSFDGMEGRAGREGTEADGWHRLAQRQRSLAPTGTILVRGVCHTAVNWAARALLSSECMDNAIRSRRALLTSRGFLPSLCFLPLSLACGGAPVADEAATPSVATESRSTAASDEAATPSVATESRSTAASVGAPAPACYPNCETQAPDAEVPSLPPIPEDHSAETPRPEACAGGAEPAVVAFDADDGIIDIASSPTHVLWSTREGLYRRAKAGGAPELLAALELPVSHFSIDGASIYWVQFPSLYAMPLDGSSAPARIAGDVMTPLAFLPHGSQLYYFSMDPSSQIPSEPCSGDSRLVAVRSTGGTPEILAHNHSTHGPMAADDTGIYWAADMPCVDDINFTPTYQIEKFSFATNSVTQFATTSGYPDSIRTAAGRVLWVDQGGIWSASADDGSARVSIAHPRLTRALATDGSKAYWAAADREGDSYSPKADVFAAPLTGGVPQQIACQVYGIEEFNFFADQRAIYYLSWVHDLIGRFPTSTE